MSYATVSISPSQKHKHIKEGRSLMKSKLTTGFQIEDHSPFTSRQPRLIYAHDNPTHLRTVKRNIKGTLHPRESYYKWNPDWGSPGINTRLIENKQVAQAKEGYISTPYLNDTYPRTRTIKRVNAHPIKKSWETPDVRYYNTAPKKGFRTVYHIVKPIDRNSRLSLLVIKKRNVALIRKKLKGESVRKVRIQNYPPKKTPSFYSYLKENEP